MSNRQSKRDADADALRNLAGGDAKDDEQTPPSAPEETQDPVDVLATMAEAAETAEPEPADEAGEQEELDEELLAAVGHEVDEGGPDATALADLPARRMSVAERKARAASLDSRASRAHHHQFKRTMIPLLIVVAGMLFVLGAVVAAILPGREPSGGGGFLRGPLAWVAVWVSFPLGALLLFGAWFFHREIREADEAERAEEEAEAAADTESEKEAPEDDASEGDEPEEKPQDEP